jgi:hypothetical protein
MLNAEPIPARFQAGAEARSRFGDRLDRLAAFLRKGDPLADAVVASFAEMPSGHGVRLLDAALVRGIDGVPDAPPSLRALFLAIDHVPIWVDWAAQDRGGAAFLRSGPLGVAALVVKSLISGYASPGGNKPLTFSGRLREQARRRLGETGRFIYAVSQPGGMRRKSEGFAITVKVRIMHAQVRRLLQRSGRFRADLWGEPINQHDMAGTLLLFSSVLIDGLERLGYPFSSADAEDLIQLWRYVGHVIGVDAELLPASFAEAKRLEDIVLATQGEPDDDSRALTEALLHVMLREARNEGERRRARMITPMLCSMCRVAVGDELADKLGVPRTRLEHAMPVLRAAFAASGAVMSLAPARGLALELGERYWRHSLGYGLGGRPADFVPPERVGGVA